MRKSRIGVLTGGGDCAGLNPAIKWVVKTALDKRLASERGVQYEVLGIRNGWKGLMYAENANLNIQDHIVPLDEEKVRTWDRYGGTMLGTSRTNPYNPKDDQSKTVLDNIEKLGLDALIVIGGDDTLGVAHKLSQEGVNVVTIVFVDNAYGTVTGIQRRQFGSRFVGNKLHNPDYVKFTESFGAIGMKCASHEELGERLNSALSADRPVVIEVPVPLMDTPWDTLIKSS